MHVSRLLFMPKTSAVAPAVALWTTIASLLSILSQTQLPFTHLHLHLFILFIGLLDSHSCRPSSAAGSDTVAPTCCYQTSITYMVHKHLLCQELIVNASDQLMTSLTQLHDVQ